VSAFDDTARAIAPLGLKLFSPEWYRAYKAEHLRRYPHLYDEPFQRSIQALDQCISCAERAAA
jgi:hypothetical protein